jgi:uncharacterized protein YndB with AHSA1/START domain
MRRLPTIYLAAALLCPAPAMAEVVGRSDQAFELRFTAEVTATPDDAWTAMIAPSGWWSSNHTYSGDAANLSLDASAGGCFCERLPASAEHPSEGPRGSVEHMRVIYVEQPRALRLAGALGPLQSEAVQGVLTVTFKPLEGGGTRILWEYNVGGSMRFKTEQIAPLMDKILGEQFGALVTKLGPKNPAAVVPAPVGGLNAAPLNYSLPPGPDKPAPAPSAVPAATPEPPVTEPAPAPSTEPAAAAAPQAAEPAPQPAAPDDAKPSVEAPKIDPVAPKPGPDTSDKATPPAAELPKPSSDPYGGL